MAYWGLFAISFGIPCALGSSYYLYMNKSLIAFLEWIYDGYKNHIFTGIYIWFFRATIFKNIWLIILNAFFLFCTYGLIWDTEKEIKYLRKTQDNDKK